MKYLGISNSENSMVALLVMYSITCNEYTISASSLPNSSDLFELSLKKKILLLLI